MSFKQERSLLIMQRSLLFMQHTALVALSAFEELGGAGAISLTSVAAHGMSPPVSRAESSSTAFFDSGTSRQATA
jgi:hypothetical protein